MFFTLEFIVRNNGGEFFDRYLDISVSNGLEIISVSPNIGWGRYEIGSLIYGEGDIDGQPTVVSTDLLYSQYIGKTGNKVEESFTVNFLAKEPGVNEYIRFRTAMRGVGQENSDDFVRYPANSPEMDQQGWPVNVTNVSITLNQSPEITSWNPLEAEHFIVPGEFLDFNVFASDPDNQSLSYTWYIDDSVSGTGTDFTYSPTANDYGKHYITCVVSDGFSTAKIRWIVNVKQIEAPVLEQIPDDTALEGVAYSGPTPVLLAGTLPVSWSIISGPSEMSIDENGVVFWNEPSIQGSPYPITIQAENTAGTTTVSWYLIVSPLPVAPVISFIDNSSITEGISYTGPQPILIEGTEPITWSLVEGPIDMTIDAVGVVEWQQPTATGSPHKVTIQAQNQAGVDTETWNITVTEKGVPPVINPISDEAILEGNHYFGPQPILAAGSIPVTWTLSMAPTGMSINPDTGVVSWPLPVVIGSPHIITIRATNNAGSTTASWKLTVSEDQVAPVIASVSDTSITVGDPYIGDKPVLTQGTYPIIWSLLEGPDEMSINQSTGEVLWPSPIPGGSTHQITIQANNDAGSDTESWSLEVKEIPEVPIIVTIADETISVDVAYTGPKPMLSQGTEPITWTLVQGPENMIIDSSTGVVKWANSTIEGNPHMITIMASNEIGSDTTTWSLEVVSNIYFKDIDEDGYGNPLDWLQSASQPDGYVTNDLDCNDSDPLQHPGQTWFKDADNDGFSDSTTWVGCLRPTGYKASIELTSSANDCDDSNPTVNPDATEICNLIDDNCNGQVNEKYTYYHLLSGCRWR